MVAIAIRFIAGRYHATPWGRHVNEADVEWPPSPWRLLRALVAIWHRKLDPEAFPETQLQQLIEVLSESQPIYRLPPAVHAHTRHYMPVREGRKDRSVLVFDAFLRVDPADELVIAWPQLQLDDESTALLDRLLTDLGFLGRAESWVEARRLESWDEELANCSPGDLSVRLETGEALEPVHLLSSMPAEEYVRWRGETNERINWESLRPRRRRLLLERTLPSSLLGALRLETGDVQAAGWSRFPGAINALYQRPEGALSVTKPITVYATSKPEPVYTTARFALAGKPRPRIEDAVKLGELLRTALMHHARRALGEDNIPEVISGHGMPADNRHQHAFYLPEDTDGDGRIDHLTLHAEAGLPADALKLFDRLRRMYQPGGNEWQIILEDVFHLATAQQTRLSPILQRSKHWISVTPYLHPWHAKRHFGVLEQLIRECRLRGLPEPEAQVLPVITVNDRVRRPVNFHRFRSRRGLTQPDTRGWFLRLTFPSVVQGPIALGFGCHFGLGMFEAVMKGDDIEPSLEK